MLVVDMLIRNISLASYYFKVDKVDNTSNCR
jgi:hypothetical protein